MKVRARTKIGIGALLTVLAVAAYLFMNGPRMYEQEHIRAYQAVMPATPEGSVAVTDALVGLPSEEEAKGLKNPLEAATENVASAKVYYGYYCAFCHGATGRGDGPVGASYVPRPSDLTSAKIRAYSDGQLLRAMLRGVGHETMLERIVPPEYRWHLVLQVRQLGASTITTKP